MNDARVYDWKVGKKDYIVGEITIQASRDEIWKVLTDYPGAPNVFDNLQKCEVIKDYGDSKLVRQVVKTGALPFTLEYLILSSEHGDKIEFRSVEGNLQMFEGHWAVSNTAAPGRTKVTYAVDIRSTSILPTSLLRKSFRGHSPVMLNQLKRKIESSS